MPPFNYGASPPLITPSNYGSFAEPTQTTPEDVFNDAETALTGNDDQEWLEKREQALKDQITLMEKNQEWNSKEAAMTRAWQEKMAQNELLYTMDQLEAKGLNKLLAVSKGVNPASVPMGATAQTGTPNMGADIYQKETAKGLGNIAMLLLSLASMIGALPPIPKKRNPIGFGA